MSGDALNWPEAIVLIASIALVGFMIWRVTR